LLVDISSINSEGEINDAPKLVFCADSQSLEELKK
jgi:hypothetical protein